MRFVGIEIDAGKIALGLAILDNAIFMALEHKMSSIIISRIRTLLVGKNEIGVLIRLGFGCFDLIVLGLPPGHWRKWTIIVITIITNEIRWIFQLHAAFSHNRLAQLRSNYIDDCNPIGFRVIGSEISDLYSTGNRGSCEQRR